MTISTTPFLDRSKAKVSTQFEGPMAASVPTQHEKLVKQTQKWVATAFFEPMLKQMRESPFKSDLLDGGKGGEAFEGMYDERLSERMAGTASNKLVNAIVNRIAKKAYDSQAIKKISSEKEGADRVRMIRAAGAVTPI